MRMAFLIGPLTVVVVPKPIFHYAPMDYTLILFVYIKTPIKF